MIYYSSDFHLDHENIIRFDERPDANINAMNNRIIGVTNEFVTEKDLFIYGGDFCLPKIATDDNDAYVARIKEHLARLRCQNIIFVAGNHDRSYLKAHGRWVPNTKLWDLFAWESMCLACQRIYDNRKAKSCCCKNNKIAEQVILNNYHPLGYELRLTKRICAEQSILEQFEGMHILCTHYSHRVWNKSHHDKNMTNLGRAINLYGHSHGGLPGFRNTFDVGFNIWNRPLSLIEILTELMPAHNKSELGKNTFSHH